MKPSSLIKDGHAEVGYYADDFIQNRVTAIATFRTAQGTHTVWMRLPHQMVKNRSAGELKNIMVCRVNRFVNKDLFGRPFNMVKRLKQTK